MLRFIAYALGGAYALLWAFWSAAAYAQTAVVAAGPTLDLTSIIVAAIGGTATIIVGVTSYLITTRSSNAQAAAVLAAAIKNSVGAIQQAADGVVVNLDPKVPLPANVPPGMAVAFQYVLDHSGDEINKLKKAGVDLSTDALVSKINAQIGLAKIASPDTPTNLGPTLPPPTLSATPATNVTGGASVLAPAIIAP